MAYGTRTTNILKAPRILTPPFLCPSLASCTVISHGFGRRRSRPSRHLFHVDAPATPSNSFPTPPQLSDLPQSCSGCGAFAQTVSPEQPGFYSTNRKSVKAFIGRNGRCLDEGYDGESEVFERVLGAADASLLAQMGLQGGGRNGTKGQMS